MMRFCVTTLLFLIGLQANALPKWISSSHTILLPEEVSRPLSATTNFSLFWWNFLVFEMNDQAWMEIDGFCKELGQKSSGMILKSACGQDLSQFHEILKDWAQDQSIRNPAPTRPQLQAGLNEALSKASLPSDPFLLSVLRTDPLGSYRKLQEMLESRVQLRFEKSRGYFFDRETRRVVIPIQLAFPPSATQQTEKFLQVLNESLASRPNLHLLGVIGPHAATLINEHQIRKDVEVIGIVGIILLVLQVAAAVWIRRWRLLLLAPPVLLSTVLASVLTYLIFGNLHGLTLAFGPGIVGLAMDHGLHSCLNTKWKGAWRANWYGLLTTVVALVAMLFSSIPFLRQLMAFSIIGLFLGFATYWILHRRYTHLFEVKPLAVDPQPGKLQFALIFATFIGLIVGAAVLRPNFSMQQMNFQTPNEQELTKWFFTHLKTKSPLLHIYGEKDQSPLPEALAQLKFSQDKQIDTENIANYLPSLEQQRENHRQWLSFCGNKGPEQEQIFFSPFWQSVCEPTHARDLVENTPGYLRDYGSNGKWITLWMAKTTAEIDAVKSAYPDAKSLPEIVELFPRLLAQETSWMAPLSILLATMLLWWYYRKIHLVLLSLIPFFVGVGFYFSLAVIFQFGISFVSLIALVMIFGLSLDYGIFATNLYTGQTGPTAHGVWTSVVLAAIVTFLGFLPLIFCHHPVLVHLGQALVFGTAGTIIGSMWGIPCLYWLYRKVSRGT